MRHGTLGIHVDAWNTSLVCSPLGEIRQTPIAPSGIATKRKGTRQAWLGRADAESSSGHMRSGAGSRRADASRFDPSALRLEPLRNPADLTVPDISRLTAPKRENLAAGMYWTERVTLTLCHHRGQGLVHFFTRERTSRLAEAGTRRRPPESSGSWE